MSKTFILTGASRGIGLAIAQHLLSAGHDLILVARTLAPLKTLQSQYRSQIQIVAGDISDPAIASQAVHAAIDEWESLDGVIANHGTLDPVARFADVEVEEWKRAFDVNFFAVVGLVKVALPYLRESKGRIIFTSSGAAANGYTAWGPYGATKAAMNHLAMTLAVEEPDITTVAVRPGVVDTDMQRDIREKHTSTMNAKDVEKYSTMHSNGQILKPEQPGNVIARLSIDAPASLSGKFLSWNDELLKDFQE